jgi:glucosamine 6-phosphate synthetase-like amidotransferase/phosphosugar isomerase protein
MCGLVGWITSEKGSDAYDRRKFIDQALILDTVRGGDSTGVFVVSNFMETGRDSVGRLEEANERRSRVRDNAGVQGAVRRRENK